MTPTRVIDDRPEVLEATSAAQHKALAHATRQRLLIALGARPSTVSRLAADLAINKGNVAHHLKVLLDAGLVRPYGTRAVRGGTERYYGRSTRRLVATGPDSGASAAALLEAVGAEVAADSREPLLYLRGVRLTQAQAEAVRLELTRIVDELEEAPIGEQRHGVLVTLYRAR